MNKPDLDFILDQEDLQAEIDYIDMRISKLKLARRNKMKLMKFKPPLSFVYMVYIENRAAYYIHNDNRYLEMGKEALKYAKKHYNVDLKTVIGTSKKFYIPKELEEELIV